MKFLVATANISTLAVAIAGTLTTVLLSPAAGATLVSSAGTWHNPIGGNGTIEYATAGNEALILWGVALSSGVKSGLGYSGYDYVGDSLFGRHLAPF